MKLEGDYRPGEKESKGREAIRSRDTGILQALGMRGGTLKTAVRDKTFSVQDTVLALFLSPSVIYFLSTPVTSIVI